MRRSVFVGCFIGSDISPIPLFQGKKQQNPLIPAVCRPKATLQVVDSIWVRRKFRYAT